VAKTYKLSDEDSLALFERVISCIKTQKKSFFTFQKLKGVHGYCEWEDGILIDYRKDLIPTVVHECIHLLEPDWSETQVGYSERRIMSTISSDDAIRLLIFFIKKL